MKQIIVLILILTGCIFFAEAQYRRIRPRIELKQFSTSRLIIQYSPDPYISGHLPDFSKRLESNLKEAEGAIGKPLTGKMNVYLFKDWEEKGAFIDDVRVAHANPDANSIYCIVNSLWDGIAERPEFQIVLRNAHGGAFSPQWEEYAASALARFWFQKKLDDWEIFLKTRDLSPVFPTLFSDQQMSRFVRHAWNASFARFLKEEYGLPAFVQFYKTGELPPDYTARWQQMFSRIPVEERKPYVFTPEFQKGMTYAYWNSYDAGYATKKSGASLAELQKIGVNWIAAIPYGFMRSSHAAEIRFPRYHIAGENDESLWALAEDAKRRNMKIMLKPQIWISHGTWTGNIQFDSREEWNLWYDNYEKWSLHYAIIAELTGAGLFCTGTELVEATLNNPDRWRSMIQKIGKIYSGPITYAANWGREFENIQFWEALDYIGLDNYYPVRTSETHGIDEMKETFATQKAKVESISMRYCRPVIFTEIGYMANNKAGMGNKEFQAEEKDYDESWQEACYRISLETYWNEPWFEGMYWWKWFSEPNDRGRSADAHSPHDRKAERILVEWYAKNRT